MTSRPKQPDTVKETFGHNHPLIRQIYNRILRSRLPKRIGVYGGVAVRKAGYFDRTTVAPYNERELVDIAARVTLPGDRVGVIGAGWGISVVTHARRVRPGGSVTVFDPSQNSIENCRSTVELNCVDDIVKLRAVGVGKPRRKEHYGTREDAEVVEPKELPRYDVLELDCEGAEVEILKQLNHTPEVLVVEYHTSIGVTWKRIHSNLVEHEYSNIWRVEPRPGKPPVAVGLRDNQRSAGLEEIESAHLV